MAPRETSTMANIAPVSIPTLPLGEILGVEEKRASVADAEGVRIEVLIGIAGRMVSGGLELDTYAVVELCDSAVVLVMNVERKGYGGSTARRSPPLLITFNVMYSSCVRIADCGIIAKIPLAVIPSAAIGTATVSINRTKAI